MGWCGRGDFTPAREAEHLKKFKDVFAAWASQEYESGRNRYGSVYFIGPVIFSYGRHFPIAKFVQNDAGKPAVLFTCRSYRTSDVTGQTTEQHKGSAWGAVKGWQAPKKLRRIREFSVMDPEAGCLACIDNYNVRLSEKAGKAKRATAHRAWHVMEYRRLLAEARAFAKFFGMLPGLIEKDKLVTHPEFFKHAQTLREVASLKWRLKKLAGKIKAVPGARPETREERMRRLAKAQFAMKSIDPRGKRSYQLGE